MFQKVDEASTLLIQNLGLFSRFVLTIWFPATVLLVYLRLHVFPEMAAGDELRALVLEIRFASAIEFVFGPFYIGAFLYAAAQIQQGYPATYRDSMVYAARKSFKLLVTRMLTIFLIMAGLFALIIPGIILGLRYAFVDEIVVFEGREGGGALKRSAELTRGYRWLILGALLLSFVILFLLQFLLYFAISTAGLEGNFIALVLYDCVSNILFLLPTTVVFLFYWQIKGQQTLEPAEHDG